MDGPKRGGRANIRPTQGTQGPDSDHYSLLWLSLVCVYVRNHFGAAATVLRARGSPR